MPRIQDLISYFSPKQSQLICDPNGGWGPSSLFEQVAWVYNSATSLTVPSDATTYYEVGDKIRLKQGGGYKYFYIVGVAATTLTITGGSDYTLTNAAITDYEISKNESPIGFPAAFNYAPTFTGFSVNPSGPVCRFFIRGRSCFVSVWLLTAGTSNATGFTISTPITVGASASFTGTCFWTGQDNGVDLAIPGRVFTQGGATTFTLDKTIAGGAWTNVNGKKASFTTWFEI